MPLYDFCCARGHKTTVLRKIADRKNPYMCSCGLLAVRQEVYPTAVQGDYPGYESPATGKWIEGKRAHLEDLARSGCRVLEPGETDAYRKTYAKRKEDSMNAAVEAAVSDVAQHFA